MKILTLRAVAAAAFLIAAPAMSQVHQAYSYDATGRLTGVITSGSSGANSASYAYDDANNRTYRGQSGVTAWAALRQIPADGLLSPNQALTSPDGRYSLALRSSGMLELWSANTAVPSELVSAFEVSPEGNARFLPPVGMLTENARLELAADGSLRMLDAEERVLWRSDVAAVGEGGQ